MNECVNVCIHGALGWTGVLFRMYPCIPYYGKELTKWMAELVNKYKSLVKLKLATVASRLIRGTTEECSSYWIKA